MYSCAVDLAGVVDRDDVRMLERGGQARLAEEALAERRSSAEVGCEQLQRDSRSSARS